MEEKYDLVIIGAGPSGIATAIEAYVLGMRNILILEKDENHNATIRKFYKENKRVDKDWKGQKVELDGTIYFMDGTKESTLDFFDQLLDHESLELRTHTEVQKIVKTEDEFDVFIEGGSIKAKYTLPLMAVGVEKKSWSLAGVILLLSMRLICVVKMR